MTKARTTSPMTRNQRRKSSEVPSEVKIRKVVPEVPRDETERGELLEDLQTMGCSGLLEKPWGFKDNRIVKELLDGVSNEFDNSIRAIPTWWTEECWKEFQHGRWWIGRTEGRVRQGLFQGAAKPQGWIRHRGLHGSAAQAGARVSCPDPVSGKAEPDNGYHG
jgi:hypothetical protein